MIQCQIYVSQCLCLDTLGSIYYQNRTITGSQSSADLIVKVNMSRCVNQIKNIFFPILRLVYSSDCLRLNGDTSLPLDIHVIQYLLLHLSAGQQTCSLYNSICQSRFAMINMCNNTEISDFTLVYM